MEVPLTKITHASSSANTVNVLLNVTGKVKVDDMTHIADIQTSGSHLQQWNFVVNQH